MGLLSLARFTFAKRRRRRRSHRHRRRQTHDDGYGPIASSEAKSKRKAASPCRKVGNSGAAKRMRSHLTLDRLPQDILHQIVALLPMQDAARAACVSQEFIRSWRYYPELTFSARTLALDGQSSYIQGQLAVDTISRINGILQNCAGLWVKRLKFELRFLHEVQSADIDHWLDAATPGVEELTLELSRDDKRKYIFPCRTFFSVKRCLIQSLCLYACGFHPEQGSCSFTSLRKVHFSWVQITTEESGRFLSNSLALERLELWHCHQIACLKIPCTLQKLNFLKVGRCNMLQTIESSAPNVSTFHYEGPIIPFSLGGSLHLKDISISIYPWFNLFDYARTELPIVAPNVETLFLMSADEVVAFFGVVSNLPPQKFFHLKHLELAIVGPRTETAFFHRYLSLVHFLIACPALETFILHVEQSAVQQSHLVIDPAKLMKRPRHRHESIKHVTITGFCPITRLMELIFYILENAVMLQCLTLDNRICGFEKDLVASISQDTETRDFEQWRNNFRDNEEFLQYMRRGTYPIPYWEAYLSYVAIKKYVLGRVPASVELKILGAPPDELMLEIVAWERREQLYHNFCKSCD